MKKILLMVVLMMNSVNANAEVAIFAGGCFWCMQPIFDPVNGVQQTVVGYTGGQTVNPSYEEVSFGNTGHFEAIKIIYDPAVVSYQKLLDLYWRNIDPTDASGQFCDRGQSYQTAIFYSNEQQQRDAKASKQLLITHNKMSKVAVQILPATTFYPAEEYHQYYYKKNPLRYKQYKTSCQRDRRLKQLWENK